MEPGRIGSWFKAVIDEVALEGLEGVTLPSLWSLLVVRLQIGQMTDKLMEQIWTYLLRSTEKISFFAIPTPRTVMPPYNRFDNVDEQLGVPVMPAACPFLRYPYAPVSDGKIFGNCADYKIRKSLSVNDLSKLTAAEATKQWDQTLVVVASQEERYSALCPPNVMKPRDITPQQYVIWEAIGRSRYNGEITVGPYSLINYCKDATIMFYIKNKLLRHQVISDQAYTEKRNERLTYARLLMLPRFYRIFKSHYQVAIEKIMVDIKESDNGQLPVSELGKYVMMAQNRAKAVRRLMVTHSFRKMFETVQLTQAHVSKSSKNSERKVTYVQLRNPDITINDLYQIQPEKEEKPVECLSFKNSYVDMPFEEEVERAIEKFGARGASGTEVAQYIGSNLLSVRGVIKYLSREGLIKEYQEHVGKQRIIRYVSNTQAGTMVRNTEQLNQTLLELQCKPEPTVPTNTDIVVADLPEIEADVRSMDMNLKETKIESKTQRHVERKILIVKQIDEKCICSIIDLRTYIQNAEKEKGLSESICRKSLMRLLYGLRESAVINVYEITLKYQQQLRLHRLVTHPKIDINHEVLQREVIRLKNNFYLLIEERNTRPSHQKSSGRKETTPRKAIADRQNEGVSDSTANIKAPAPKLLVGRTLHEFLYYLISELPRDKMPLEMNVELLQQWQRTEPALQTREFFEEWQASESHVNPYTNEISWRTFIPPLPRYDDKPAGWLYFVDAIERIPLSVFQHIFRIERYNAGELLRPYLQHPVKQHYLMRQLTIEAQGIVPRLQLQQLYIGALRLLNNMGLVQVTERQLGRDPLQRWVYFNRRTRILDTTITEPSYTKVNESLQYTAIKFTFESRENVAQYWAQLQQICIYTKLGYVKRKTTGTAAHAVRFKPIGFVGFVEFEQAQEQDNGSVPGDQLGAAGLSSMLFAHQFRHWSCVQSKMSSSQVVRKRLAFSRAKPPKLQLRKVRGRTRTTHIKGTGSASSSAGNNKRKYGPRDDIDRDALKNMRTLRVTWSANEDRLLKMGRAVYLFIDAPIPALGLSSVGTVCRDIIRHYLGICNKTTQACVRRLQFLMRMKRDTPDVPNWLYTMQTQPEFNNIYNEGFLTALKTEYPNRSEYNDALLVHFVLVLSKLHKLVISTNGSVRQFLLADTLTEYQSQLRECMPLSGEQLLYYQNPKKSVELQVIMAQCVLHSTLCCAKDKTLFNLQAFEIYKHFSEDVLNAAFNKARLEGLVVTMKRRNLQVINLQVSGPTHLLSSKYKYRLIYLKLPHTVYENYYAFEQQALNKFYADETTESADNFLELQSPNFAQLLFLGEWLANNYLSITVRLPANILTVDTNSEPRQVSTDRILDHYSCILDNAPKTEYAKRMENECSRQTARVRFLPANLSYKVQCSPYDQLSKLPLRSMHFFCALDQLEQIVQISFAKETSECQCPFNCIMRSGNYLNAIERIVHKHRLTLRQMVTDALPQKQVNLSFTANNSLTVESSNLLTLMQHLESHWRELEQPQELKDLGKTLASKTLNKHIDWRALCADLLEYDPQMWEAERTREYEPALNKEERARAQDVFVVHLPKLQLRLGENLSRTNNQLEWVTRENSANSEYVPRMLMEAQLSRKTLLDKVNREACWRYTENTFETLRPLLVKRQYDDAAIQSMEDILKYIEQKELGVLATELRRQFTRGDFLLEALHLLAEHYLIKRVGVADFTYVHKQHMRDWVVHTFHIKRLERERVQRLVASAPNTPTAVADQKRKHVNEMNEQDEDQPSTSKTVKLSPIKEADTSDDEPQPKRLRQRRHSSAEPVASVPSVATTAELPREVIVMRPQPWIRVNASLNRRVLDRWLSTILSECIARTGCTVHSLFLRFPHLMPVDIMILLELLGDLKCIHLMELQPQTVHIESGGDDCIEELVTELYEPTFTYIVAHGDAVRRLNSFIGVKKYSTEFV